MNYSKYKKIAIILFIISILINIFNKCFASTSISLIPVGNTAYTLNVDIENHIATLNDVSIAPEVWQHEHLCFINYMSNWSRRILIICWDGDLYIGTGVVPSAPNGTFIYNPNKFYYYNAIYQNTPNDFGTSFSNYSFTTYTDAGGGGALDVNNVVYSSGDIYDKDGNIIYNSNYVSFNYPYFNNPYADISSLNFDNLYIEPADYGIDNSLNLHILKIAYSVSDDNDTIYYYDDRVFSFDKNSKYLVQFLDSDRYYYSIPRWKLGLDTNSEYLFVLSDNSNPINNSVGSIVKDTSSGIYDVASVNTTNIYTSQDVMNDNLHNINDDLSSTDSDISNSDIEDTMGFDNNNSDLSNMNTGFFSRLATMLSSLVGYNLSDDTTVEIPIPKSDEKIVLHSNILYNNVGAPLLLIINAFWLYIFSFYMWKFINKIYIAISTGNILDTFSSSGEAITNNML